MLYNKYFYYIKLIDPLSFFNFLVPNMTFESRVGVSILAIVGPLTLNLHGATGKPEHSDSNHW